MFRSKKEPSEVNTAKPKEKSYVLSGIAKSIYNDAIIQEGSSISHNSVWTDKIFGDEDGYNSDELINSDISDSNTPTDI